MSEVVRSFTWVDWFAVTQFAPLADALVQVIQPAGSVVACSVHLSFFNYH